LIIALKANQVQGFGHRVKLCFEIQPKKKQMQSVRIIVLSQNTETENRIPHTSIFSFALSDSRVCATVLSSCALWNVFSSFSQAAAEMNPFNSSGTSRRAAARCLAPAMPRRCRCVERHNLTHLKANLETRISLHRFEG
jgi:hypothetical protein